MSTLWVMGGANWDTTVTLDSLPPVGASVFAQTLSEGIGGKGVNQAIAARRAGADVSLIAAIGDDSEGERITAFLEEEGIEQVGVVVHAGLRSGRAFIQVDRRADNTIVVCQGANAALAMETVDFGALIESADTVAANLEVPLPVVRALLQDAGNKGVRRVLNPSPMQREGLHDLVGACDTLIVNELEADALVGPHRNVTATLRELERLGPTEVVLTLGSDGCAISVGGSVDRVPAPVVAAVDSTAAGDTFLGYYSAARLRGESPADAGRIATAAAALCVESLGSAESIPHRRSLTTPEESLRLPYSMLDSE